MRSSVSPSFGQYVSSVGLYSSEYGCGQDGPQVYTASNLVGKPSCYPTYGDHPRTYSLREYGRWWHCCPSAAPPLPDRRPPRPPALAFVDVKFAVAVSPEHVDIFETNQCGSVVRVWGLGSCGRWWLLWEGTASPDKKHVARKFSPTIRRIDASVSLLRLEMDYSQHSYNSCLDGVLLTGTAPLPLRLGDDVMVNCHASQHHDIDTLPAEDEVISIENNDEVVDHSEDDDRIEVVDGDEGEHGLLDNREESSDNEFDVLTVDDDTDSTDASATRGCSPTNPSLLCLIQEDLTCLNICNKVIMHGLQNTVRLRDEILRQGPEKLGSFLIRDLLSIFLSGDTEGKMSAVAGSAARASATTTTTTAAVAGSPARASATAAVTTTTTGTTTISNTNAATTAVVAGTNPATRTTASMSVGHVTAANTVASSSAAAAAATTTTGDTCISTASAVDTNGSVQEGGYFHNLPPELTLRILSLLDLRSLCRVAQTCTALRALSYHPHLYTHITLKDWWWVVDNCTLHSLTTRLSITPAPASDTSSVGGGSRRGSDTTSDWGPASGSATDGGRHNTSDAGLPQASGNISDGGAPAPAASNDGWSAGIWDTSESEETIDSTVATLRNKNSESSNSLPELTPASSVLVALDLSWCGPYGAITDATFLEFVYNCGHSLRILRLSCCDFVDNYCLYIIANVCADITELDVSRCYELDFLGLGELKKLSLLTRLDVSYTKLQTETVHVLLQHTPRLQHLNISGCQHLEVDEACVALARFCPRLQSLCAWKTQGLTRRGLRALASLTYLQDLDVGWAFSGGVSLSGGVVELVEQCQWLTRLRLAASRYLNDGDVSAIARCCPNLQQLDVMGNANLSPEPLFSVLLQCPCLQLLEVSYCAKITVPLAGYWRRLYPHVQINAGAEAVRVDL